MNSTTSKWTHHRAKALTLIFVTLFCVNGCGGSLSKAQVDRVRLGMTVTEVEDLLGKGKPAPNSETENLVQTSLSGDGGGAKIEIDYAELRGIRWGDEKRSVTVVFRNDKVFRVFPQGLDK